MKGFRFSRGCVPRPKVSWEPYVLWRPETEIETENRARGISPNMFWGCCPGCFDEKADEMCEVKALPLYRSNFKRNDCIQKNRDAYGDTMKNRGKSTGTNCSEVNVSSQGVVLGFELPNGTTTGVTCFQRPLGMQYSKSLPVTVTMVHQESHAAQLGIEEGWRLRYVGEEDMVDRSFAYVLGTLCKTTSHLPFV